MNNMLIGTHLLARNTIYLFTHTDNESALFDKTASSAIVAKTILLLLCIHVSPSISISYYKHIHKINQLLLSLGKYNGASTKSNFFEAPRR